MGSESVYLIFRIHYKSGHKKSLPYTKREALNSSIVFGIWG
jgi:hypothetical protein